MNAERLADLRERAHAFRPVDNDDVIELLEERDRLAEALRLIASKSAASLVLSGDIAASQMVQQARKALAGLPTNQNENEDG